MSIRVLICDDDSLIRESLKVLLPLKGDIEIVAEGEDGQQAIDLCNSGKCDVLVLDEIIGAVNNKTVDYEMLVDFLKNRPENIEVIMTGRNPKEELIEIADYVSEVNKVKHPFDKGIAAREGVEK